MSRGLCAYAITRDHPLDPTGPREIRLISHEGLGLVVAEVDLAPFAELETDPAHWVKEPAEDDPLVVLAYRHDVVVRAVFEHEPVLPLRFGTVLRDERAAVRLLTDHHAEASTTLDRVDGHREWGVRVRLAHPGTPATVSTEGMSGTEYLAMRRDRLAAAARTRRDGSAAAAALHEALAGHAAESLQRTRKSATPLLDAAYLVPAGAEPVFHAEAARHEELAVEVTGPWPPYSFVRLALSTGTVAHA
jgi:gas vesicle protein GvpL/GvpF